MRPRRRLYPQRYATLEETDYDGPIGVDDRDYTWESFTAARELFDRASRGGRAIIFTVDQ